MINTVVGLIVILLIIVIPAVILIAGGPSVRKFAAQAALMFAIVVVGFVVLSALFLVPARTTLRPISSPTEMVFDNEIAVPTEISTAWLPNVESNHKADKYSSLSYAGRALARSMAAEIRQEFPKTKIESIHLPNNSNAASEGFIAFQQTLREEFLGVPFENSSNPTNGIAVTFSHSKSSHGISNGISTVSGTIRSELVGKPRHAQADYQYKQWVAAFDAFQNEHINQGYFRVESPELLMKPQDVYQSTVAAAARQLAPRLRREYRRRGKYAPKQDDELQYVLYEAIMSGEVPFVRDRFSQKIDYHGEEMWRDVLLLQVNPSLLGTIVNRNSFAPDSGRLHQIVTVIGFFCVVSIAFWVADAATKGYYKSTLIVLGTIVVLAGLGITFFLS